MHDLWWCFLHDIACGQDIERMLSEVAIAIAIATIYSNNIHIATQVAVQAHSYSYTAKRYVYI